MGERAFRQRVFDLLRGEDLEDSLAELRRLPSQKLLKPLFSAICSGDELLKWHAVTAMGQTVAALAAKDREAARVVLRRFMWSLNDESGGIGWGVPEAMGEVLAWHAGLAEEYAHLLVGFMREEGFYLEYEPLQRGLMWGIGRLAQVRPDLLRTKQADTYLLPYLDSPDPAVRGLAARALGWLGAGAASSSLQALLKDEAPVRFYEQNALITLSVGELARQALAHLGLPSSATRA